MSVESRLKESVLKTAIFHLLRKQSPSADRTARNIQELLIRFCSEDSRSPLNYEELLRKIQTASREDCVDWIIQKLS